MHNFRPKIVATGAKLQVTFHRLTQVIRLYFSEMNKTMLTFYLAPLSSYGAVLSNYRL